MELSPAIERALDMCYDSIASPKIWTGALDNLAHALDATACQILPHEVSQRSFGVVRSTRAWRIDEQWRRNLDWVSDVYVTRGTPFVSHGIPAVIQSQLFTEDEISHSRFHQEITGPVGCLHWACGIFYVEDRMWCLPFYRAHEQFTPDSLAPIAEIARRMARIIGLAEKLSSTWADNEILTLEKVGCAALLIDRHGRVARTNQQAESLFCNEFGIRHGRLWTAGNTSLQRLDRYMAEIKAASRKAAPLPAPVILARNDAPWLLVEALPVNNASNDIFDGCHTLLVVSDLTRPSLTDGALLCTVFGLTSAEARLACALCEGHDLNAAAAAFGVSRETVRSQLKAVFAKTGTRRQAELVAQVTHLRNTIHH